MAHRATWDFIHGQLDAIDFSSKTVLDIGCWDGMWSFYAERRGASHVLSTDDVSQNWASGAGARLARELFQSAIELDQKQSIYELDTIDRTFDIIFCMGVYYHLHDPFFASAQLRKRCHPETIVVIEGDATAGLKANTALIDFSNRHSSTFVPTLPVLNDMLAAAYFTVQSQTWMAPQRYSTGPRLIWQKTPLHLDVGLPRRSTRVVTIVRPFTGENRLHLYKPPFGLAAFDPRYSGSDPEMLG